MDSELSSKISSIVSELAVAEQERLKAAGTFVELEDLASEIGDEVTRQLMGHELSDRSNEVAQDDTALCPDCGECCHRCEASHRQLQSSRGTISYHEPGFNCRQYRRSFFPSSRSNGTAGPRNGHSEANATDGLGG